MCARACVCFVLVLKAVRVRVVLRMNAPTGGGERETGCLYSQQSPIQFACLDGQVVCIAALSLSMPAGCIERREFCAMAHEGELSGLLDCCFAIKPNLPMPNHSFNPVCG